MRQRGITGAENRIVAEIDAQLLLERVVHVDAGQNAEPLLLEGLDDPGQRLLVGLVYRDLIGHASHLRYLTLELLNI